MGTSVLSTKSSSSAAAAAKQPFLGTQPLPFSEDSPEFVFPGYVFFQFLPEL
jgi:hypothetical protein